MQELKQTSESVNMRKYHIPCADRINSNNLDTSSWLNNLTYLKTIDGSKSIMSHKKILEGILDNKNDKVIITASLRDTLFMHHYYYHASC